MASVLPDPRQKRDFMASGDNRGQKGMPFVQAESRK